jgi:serine/threonine protein kinase
MKKPQPGMLKSIQRDDFPETLVLSYRPRKKELFAPVRHMLPVDWTLMKGGGWFICNAPGQEMLLQGWKIHLSATRQNVLPILRRVVPALVESNTSFKFAMDLNMVEMMTGKVWSRGGGGKVLTIYPSSTAEFRVLIERLHELTREFAGPYILSDKRYRDSLVIGYRYGGILPVDEVNVRGEIVSALVAPDGRRVPDIRNPYFTVPDWESDPFPDEANPNQPASVPPAEIRLKNDRYLVRQPLAFSNAGGVYLAYDQETGREVVLKEARPRVFFWEDAVTLLEREYRLLSLLEDTGVTPRPLDYFQEWEHWFLVEEHLPGVTLRTFRARHSVSLMTRPGVEDTRAELDVFVRIFRRLAEAIEKIHGVNIVLCDLSDNNVIINPETLDVKVIDAGCAFEIGVDQPVHVFTPGFAAPDQVNGAPGNMANDYYSLGAMMLSFLSPLHAQTVINPESMDAVLHDIIRDIAFPPVIESLIARLLSERPAARPTAREIIATLDAATDYGSPGIEVDSQAIEAETDTTVSEVFRLIDRVATRDREDRLFPADHRVFSTNPLSIAWGACGVVHAMRGCGRRVSQRILDWIAGRTISPELYAPGLYTGMAGVAWTLLECGVRDRAEEIMRMSHAHPLLLASPSLLHGVSGWGMANLKFFRATGDELYLDHAIRAAGMLRETAQRDDRGIYWKQDGDIPVGLGHGASGVALFLLYLFLVTRDEFHLDLGRRALDFDLRHGHDNLDRQGISWPRSADGRQVLYPYWESGSAGVGVSLSRYQKLCPEPRYADLLTRILLDTDRKYAVFPGRFNGLAGIGDFLIDAWQFTRDERFLRAAYKVASGLFLFRMPRRQGMAFPGDELEKASCDFATGSAGIALFLHRLKYQTAGSYVLDELFDDVERPAPPLALAAAY